MDEPDRENVELRNNPSAIMILEIVPEVSRRVLPANPGQEKIRKEEVK